MTARGWYVVHTHANAETKAVAHLTRQGYRTYLPVYQRRHRHARREREVLRPLFPRYVFVSLDPERDQWRGILSTTGVADLLRQGNQPIPVPQEAVDLLFAQERDGVIEESATLPKFKVGDRVLVSSGPFLDLIGKFQGMADQQRVFVLLELLGRQVRASLPIGALAAV